MAYAPIEEHGVIGDLHTVALVTTDGTIDWYCCPRFDAPSVFGAILDDRRGGRFRIGPERADAIRKQLYLPDTNVLITRFLSPNGVCELVDFMPVSSVDVERHWLVRQVRCVRGSMRLRLDLEPRFDYGRAAAPADVMDEHGAVFDVGRPDAARSTRRSRSRAPAATCGRSSRSRPATCSRSCSSASPRTATHSRPVAPEFASQLFDETADYWRRWIARLHLPRPLARDGAPLGAGAEAAHLPARPGAIVAASTDEPAREHVGGVRNWDYRYTWMRDSAFTLYAMLRLGFSEEAEGFMRFLQDRALEADSTSPAPIQIMYGIDGRSHLDEVVLDHWEGYRGSRPVRIGNGAAEQLQLDIFGELIDSVYLYDKFGAPISYDLWKVVAEPAGVARRPLAREGRGHLGGARRQAGVHLLAPDELGRLRARHPHGPPARPAGAARAVARDARPDLRDDHGPAAGPTSARPSCRCSTATSSTPPRC